VIPYDKWSLERVRGLFTRRAIQIDVYFTLLYFTSREKLNLPIDHAWSAGGIVQEDLVKGVMVNVSWSWHLVDDHAIDTVVLESLIG